MNGSRWNSRSLLRLWKRLLPTRRGGRGIEVVTRSFVREGVLGGTKSYPQPKGEDKYAKKNDFNGLRYTTG